MSILPQYQQFIDVFLAKNAQLNLSAIRDEEGVRVKHVLDAIELEKAFPMPKGAVVVDVGTGGGIPLLPLAITYPENQFTGLDSVRKKVEAVADMAHTLGLQNVKTVRSRSEDYTGSFDILTARAVAFSDELFRNTYHLVKKGGYFILYKMFSEQEESRLDSYVMQRNMTMIRKHYYKLFEEDIQRVIYVIQK